MYIHLIDAKAGDVLYQKKFKETQSYSYPNQTAYLAFFDLISEIKAKLFRELMGGEKLQERYLITH
jgi:hypothetical protein